MLISAVEFRGHMDRKDTRRDQIAGELAPGVSVIVPAYNEEVEASSPRCSALLALRYPRHEVVVVDDRFKDSTFARLADAYGLVEDGAPHPGNDVATKPAPVLSVHVPRRRPHPARHHVARPTPAGPTRLNVGINVAPPRLVLLRRRRLAA